MATKPTDEKQTETPVDAEAVEQTAVDTTDIVEQPAGEAAETVLVVTAKVDGFRRAGREWYGTTEVAASEFTEAQLEQLMYEPKLHVVPRS